MPTICYANTIDYSHPLQQRPHHLLNLFAKNGCKVYWVDGNKTEGKARSRISENLEVYYNWDVFKKRVPEVDVYFSSWSARHKDLNEITAKICLYDSLDNFPDNEKEEHLMIQKSDIVLTTSQGLYDLRKQQHDNVHMVRNACFDKYIDSSFEIPEDIKSLKRPIIFFAGALSNTWCDIELVEQIAKRYTVVFLGLKWGNNINLSENIHFLGQKTHEQLQAYYQHCDLCILPFQRCQIADFSNPIKLYEAMAHGKLTIATDIPEAKLFPSAVLYSRNREEFMNNIKDALRMSKDIDIINKCKQYARQNTWEQRFADIEKAIYDFAVKKRIKL